MLDLLRDRDAANADTLGEVLARRGISRRAFLKYASSVAASMALSPAMAQTMARLGQGGAPPGLRAASSVLARIAASSV